MVFLRRNNNKSWFDAIFKVIVEVATQLYFCEFRQTLFERGYISNAVVFRYRGVLPPRIGSQDPKGKELVRAAILILDATAKNTCVTIPHVQAKMIKNRKRNCSKEQTTIKVARCVNSRVFAVSAHFTFLLPTQDFLVFIKSVVEHIEHCWSPPCFPALVDVNKLLSNHATTNVFSVVVKDLYTINLSVISHAVNISQNLARETNCRSGCHEMQCWV